MADGLGLGGNGQRKITTLERIGLGLGNLGAGIMGDPFPSEAFHERRSREAARRSQAGLAEKQLGLQERGVIATEGNLAARQAEVVLRQDESKRKQRAADLLAMQAGNEIIKEGARAYRKALKEENQEAVKAIEDRISEVLGADMLPLLKLEAANPGGLPESMVEAAKTDPEIERLFELDKFTEEQTGVPGTALTDYATSDEYRQGNYDRYDDQNMAEAKSAVDILIEGWKKRDPEGYAKAAENDLTPNELSIANDKAFGPPGVDGAEQISEELWPTIRRRAAALGLQPTAVELARRTALAKAVAKPPVNLFKPGTDEQLSFPAGDPRIKEHTDKGWIKQPGATTGKEAGLLGVGGQAVAMKQINEVQAETEKFVRLAIRTKELVHNRPEVLGMAGDFARLADAAAFQAEGFARLLNYDFFIERPAGKESVTADDVKRYALENYSEHADKFIDRFNIAAVDRARVRSAVVGLAFAAAAAAGQTGRAVSDRDVERFMRRIGDSASPAQFVGVLDDMLDEVIDGFEITHRVMGRGVNKELLGEMPDLRKMYGVGLTRERDETTPAAILKMPRDQLRALPVDLLDPNQLRAIGQRLDELGEP